jgi:hypothetical protein
LRPVRIGLIVADGAIVSGRASAARRGAGAARLATSRPLVAVGNPRAIRQYLTGEGWVRADDTGARTQPLPPPRAAGGSRTGAVAGMLEDITDNGVEQAADLAGTCREYRFPVRTVQAAGLAHLVLAALGSQTSRPPAVEVCGQPQWLPQAAG